MPKVANNAHKGIKVTTRTLYNAHDADAYIVDPMNVF